MLKAQLQIRENCAPPQVGTKHCSSSAQPLFHSWCSRGALPSGYSAVICMPTNAPPEDAPVVTGVHAFPSMADVSNDNKIKPLNLQGKGNTGRQLKWASVSHWPKNANEPWQHTAAVGNDGAPTPHLSTCLPSIHNSLRPSSEQKV